jgi:hypothetical protein
VDDLTTAEPSVSAQISDYAAALILGITAADMGMLGMEQEGGLVTRVWELVMEGELVMELEQIQTQQEQVQEQIQVSSYS